MRHFMFRPISVKFLEQISETQNKIRLLCLKSNGARSEFRSVVFDTKIGPKRETINWFDLELEYQIGGRSTCKWKK